MNDIDIDAAIDDYIAKAGEKERVAAVVADLRRQLDAATEELRARHAQERTWQSKAEAAVEEAGALQRELERVKKEATDTFALLKVSEAKLNERTH